jgi:serine/threonine-protein kinase
MADDNFGDQATIPATLVRVALADPKNQAPALAGSTRYRPQGLLGKGGMGEVRAVEDDIIGREVAVKTIAPTISGDSGIRERFLREVRIQGQLEHPSIVPVYDLGIDEAGHDYFTMRRIAGRTLAKVLAGLARRDDEVVAAFPRNTLLSVFRQICLAAAYAHSKGVVHRDLKPANVMIGDFGEVYILDWGLARILGEPADDEADQILGTPGYMAPEQINDATSVDTRADVYSLGTILFELLSLEPLHPRALEAAIASTTSEPSGRPGERAPNRDIPPELDDLCARATAGNPAERLPSARALADAVERYLEGDRDLERRRAQARDHASAARAARDRVTEARTSSEAVEARREALREAGRAVALDPDGRDGMRVALELMLAPPREMPADLAAELERAQSDRIRVGIIPGIVVFAGFLAFALALPAIAGAIDWTIPAIIAIAMSVPIAMGLRRLRIPNLASARRGAFLSAASLFLAIGLSSVYLGPMMLIPSLAIATATSLVASQLRWRMTLALAISSLLVPTILEWAHVTPTTYHFGADAIVVTSNVIRLPELTIRLSALGITLLALVGSVRYVRRIVVVETELRERWLLQNWHLRQMAHVDDR